MKKLLITAAIFWITVLALCPAAQAQTGPSTQPTVDSPNTPGETIFLTIYKRDSNLLRATFDTDGHPVGGLSPKALNEKFDKTYSLARILNFLRQNGYRVTSFVPYTSEDRLPDSYWLILEYTKPQP